MLNVVSGKVADYSKEIYVFIPLTGDQPVVMYTSLSRGITSKHYLGLELKLKYSGGLYTYKPEQKPFDITQHEWSDVIAEIEPESGHTLVIKSHGSWLSFDKDDVIAMARDRGVTAEDLK